MHFTDDQGDSEDCSSMRNVLLDYYNNFRPSAFQCCKSETTGFVSGFRMWLAPMEYVYVEDAMGVPIGQPFPESDSKEA